MVPGQDPVQALDDDIEIAYPPSLFTWKSNAPGSEVFETTHIYNADSSL